jgi:hypothetical protein
MLRLKYRYLAAFVSQLYSMAVNKLFGSLSGIVILLAEKVYAVLDVTVPTDDVRPIPVHGGSTLAAAVRGS